MFENKRIICGKFDAQIHIVLPNDKNKRIRIGSTNPNTLKKQIYQPISTNGKVILYNNTLYETRQFLAESNKSILNKIIVLTLKEKELILEALVDFDIDVKVFEVIYPIFNHIKYISNIYKNYEELTKLLDKVNEFNIKGNSLAKNLSTEYLYKIERKLRFKNKLDYFFAFAYKGGYSEVFKLKEEREDRVIVAFDYNSMYVDSMMGKFMEPKSIKYKNYRNEKINLDQLENGLYRVILKNIKDTFFKKFHPFKYMKQNSSFYFNIEENQYIEILLFKNEIEYYKRFFNDIEIIEGFYSKNEIDHPLKEYAQNLYKERLRYKTEGNTLMNDLCKYKLITIHSSTNAKRFKKLYFSTKGEIVNYLSLKYMINFPEHLTSEEKLALFEDKNYFTFTKYKNGYQTKMINFNTYESVYSLSSQILANSRIKMLQTIEKFLQHNSVEICYINIDSIHISIQKEELDAFLIKNKNIISNKLGDLKIESISEKGYWFDIGRYWLMSNNKVDIFKNSFFNQKNNSNKFVFNRKLNYISANSQFSYVKTVYTNIYKAFSYHKKIVDSSLDKIDFERYNFEEIYDLNVAQSSYTQETLKSKKVKVDLVKKISTV